MADNPGTQDFLRLGDPLWRELRAHCYRMLGSVQDAEDLVQETYLRAWRSYDSFEGRSSLRSWLYQIATRACLTALKNRSRRPSPAGLLGTSADAVAEGTDPAAVVTSRASIRLALIVALQHLSPRQRAVLILRDVLKWPAAEVADLLGTTATAVNSVRQRARAQLDQVAAREDEIVEPTAPDHRELLDRYVAAFEDHDIAALAELIAGSPEGDDRLGRLTSVLSHCWSTGRGISVCRPTSGPQARARKSRASPCDRPAARP
ncbi:MAG: sigma-70 family RNA polymerase sigma factor [Streptosporangiales bacterium]|nr:sigma-70 family RNA polymerase sigma factor [Streptosporangiales bacterium]